MEIRAYNESSIGIVVSDEILINNVQDAVDLLGNTYYQGFEKLIIFKNNLNEDFFDLRTGIAGSILQKFSNYRIKLAIVGDYSKYKSKNFNDFIYECNKSGQINFVSSQDEALNVLK